MLAGQSHDQASAFTADAAAARWPGPPTADLPTVPEWMTDVLALDPRRVLFAHDQAVWEPS